MWWCVPIFGAAKAAEIAFGLIGANAFVHERNRVIDALRIPTRVKRIPARAFVGVDGRERANAVANDRASVALIGDHERQRAALALAHDDDALALAGLVGLQAAVLAIFFAVFRADVTAKIAAVDFDNAVQLTPACSRAIASRSLCERTKAVLY